ncbi:hypothetical protein HOY82DRAFT_534897 [Tuber indicum]|nr:hypothetical protein HOY82DRAFT_534897 [Tuber indicum]
MFALGLAVIVAVSIMFVAMEIPTVKRVVRSTILLVTTIKHFLSAILAVPTQATATTTSALDIAHQRKLPHGIVVLLLAFYYRNLCTVNHLAAAIAAGYKSPALSKVPDAVTSLMAFAGFPVIVS